MFEQNLKRTRCANLDPKVTQKLEHKARTCATTCTLKQTIIVLHMHVHVQAQSMYAFKSPLPVHVSSGYTPQTLDREERAAHIVCRPCVHVAGIHVHGYQVLIISPYMYKLVMEVKLQPLGSKHSSTDRSVSLNLRARTRKCTKEKQNR